MPTCTSFAPASISSTIAASVAATNAASKASTFTFFVDFFAGFADFFAGRFLFPLGLPTGWPGLTAPLLSAVSCRHPFETSGSWKLLSSPATQKISPSRWQLAMSCVPSKYL